MTYHRRINGVCPMTNGRFENLVRRIVSDYTNAHGDVTDEAPQLKPEDVYIVWSCKTLQNNKALASTPRLDGMYYEITYNGDKDELYVDAYKKFENKCIPGRLFPIE